MCKVYKTKEDAKAAVKRAVQIRAQWEDAVHTKATREELEENGLKTVAIHDN